MARRPRIRPISHDDQLTVVDHLDELRSRLMIAGAAFFAAFVLCGWQNKLILDIVNEPLPDGREPITFGVTEPFLTTFTNAAYAAILLSLPIILYQVYAFVLPAFSPTERRVALPLLLMVPVLFIAGVLFCYYVVLPPATDFLLSFNASEFDTEVRARDYYSFATLTMLAMGLGFQVPVAILAAVRLGVTSVEKLRRNRRYAIVVIAVLASLLPTIDPVTMVLEMVPLLLLYEASILLAAAFGRPAPEVSDRVASVEGS
jgi:sec-independent protein translocase protein TatC